MKISNNARINLKEYTHDSSYYRFENGDGTQYTVHICHCEHGGFYVICNDSSLWMGFKGDLHLKFLCGNNNEFTKLALTQLLVAKEWI
jgi:hypothetical protein